MKMRNSFVALFVALLAVPVVAQQGQSNQNRLLIAASSSSGTYKAMLAEIKDVCSTDTFVIDQSPDKGGAVDNLEALVNNQVSAAFLHSDVIYSAAMADPNYRNLKTLVALYPEEIHVLALRNSLAKAGGVGGYFAKTVEFSALTDLAGFNVGAAGGGVITARLLTGQGDGKFNVIPYDSGKEVIDALRAGQIHAAIFVGGAPLPNLSVLKAEEFKLLPIGENITGRMNGVYRPATVTYTNLKSTNIRTLAPQALIVTRKYTTAKMIEPQKQFRQCFYDNIEDLKETPGRHPKWQQVDPLDHGVWEWYDIPNVSPKAPTKK